MLSNRVLFILFFISYVGAQDGRILPSPSGQLIIEPFFDPRLSGLDCWQKDDRANLSQKWCWAEVDWNGGAAELSRDFNVNIDGFDTLILSMSAAPRTFISLIAKSDIGLLVGRWQVGNNYNAEYSIKTDGAKIIKSIHISLESSNFSIAHLLWIAIADSAVLEGERRKWKTALECSKDVYLSTPGVSVSLGPKYEIVLSRSELKQIRDARRHFGLVDGAKEEKKDEIKILKDIGCREFKSGDLGMHRRFDRPDSWDGDPMVISRCAFKAAIDSDIDLMRKVAAAAINMSMTARWDFLMACVPGSTWDHRSFSHSIISWNLVAAIDLCGDVLNELGRDLILRRLAEEGIGNMNYVTWRYDYIFDCNQYLVFSKGKIFSLMLLEKKWKHVSPYLDLAINELGEAISGNILSDGGFSEGPAYLFYSLDQLLPVASMIHRVRPSAFGALSPNVLLNTSKYIDVLLSTDEVGCLIPVGGSTNTGFIRPPISVLSQMSNLFPGSVWESMWNWIDPGQVTSEPPSSPIWRDLRLNTLSAYGLPPRISEGINVLPDSGLASSVREIDNDDLVKICIIGGVRGADHNHEDKGSFVLEFAGETFACDPGGWPYHDPLSSLQIQAQRHNMLVPARSESVRRSPRNPLNKNITPVIAGDREFFYGFIDPGESWPDDYKYWRREFISDSPWNLSVIDSWSLIYPGGVRNCWMTFLPVYIHRDCNLVEIVGAKHMALITIPNDVIVLLDRLPHPTGGINRISFCVDKKEGQLGLNVHFITPE